MQDQLSYPLDLNVIVRKKKAFKRALLSNTKKKLDFRIAILGGSTTAEIRDILELFLLRIGIQAVFYESQYNRYYDEAVFDNATLDSFKPQFVIIHTGIVNIQSYPDFTDSEEEVNKKVKQMVDTYETIWTRLHERYHCEIIQNNFELPHYRLLGNLDAVDYRGRVNYVLNLNMEFSSAARTKNYLHINDVHYLSSMMGIQEWFDPSYWFAFKYSLSYKAIPVFCNNVSNILGAILGKSKKLLVVDLDNTLWGGVIGDDGVHGIELGKDTARGEAFLEFQHYLKCLKKRGLLLAVCSKNDMTSVREGLLHPDSILKLDDFTVIKASWDQKDTLIQEIAKELNVGLDSIVFVDDNPVERELVGTNLPDVDVPNIGTDEVFFPGVIDQAGYFETTTLLKDDINRNQYYNENVTRLQDEAKFITHDDFLNSLQMVAEIDTFNRIYIERIFQLTNKTNQFNLTVKRYTQTEIDHVLDNPAFIGLYGKLRDKFGDNGLVSVMLGRIGDHKDIHIDLWVMSCRVFNREMEFAMFDEFVGKCVQNEIDTIYGYYTPSEKNRIVSNLFSHIGFKMVDTMETGATIWKFTLTEEFKKIPTKIEVNGVQHG